MLTVTASYAPNHAVMDRAPFDLIKDIAHVTRLTTQAYILLIHPSVPATNVKEFVAAARNAAHPFTYGSSGVTTLQHLAGVMLGSVSGAKVIHVPYKGGALALTDMVAGRLQFFFGVMLSSMPHIKSGKLNALAITSSRHAAIIPDVPTIAESGYPGYVVDNWYGVGVPAKTPTEIVTRLNAEIARALKAPAVAQRLRADGSEPSGIAPAAISEIVKTDLQRWRKIVKESGIKAES